MSDYEFKKVDQQILMAQKKGELNPQSLITSFCQ